MIAQRPTSATPVVQASGMAMPFSTNSFEAVLAALTLHHWGDWSSGLSELARVAPLRVIVTLDFEVHARFWLLEDYLPEVAEAERQLHPSPTDIASVIPLAQSVALPLPPDLADGVLGSFWQKPAAYLDPATRANSSPLALADQAHIEIGINRLGSDLADGTWHKRYGHLFELDQLDLGYRLLVSEGDANGAG
jgi:SAM-dependent methyltransferase